MAMTATAPPPPAPPTRGNVLRVGTYLSVAAGMALIGGVLAVYFSSRGAARVAHTPWPPKGVKLPNVALLVSYTTLLMSSFTAQWSVAAIKLNDRRNMYTAIGATLVLGAAFVNGMTFCWSRLALQAGTSRYADVVYAVTVTHVLVVVAAAALFIVMAFRALGGQFSAANREFVDCAATVWHFAVLSGAVIWFCLWFLEGGPGTK